MCNGNATQIYRYDLYEYDCNGVAHKSGQVFNLDMAAVKAKYGAVNPASVIMAFYQEFFPTMNILSGFSATFDGKSSEMDIITIRWKTPIWKLVRIN